MLKHPGIVHVQFVGAVESDVWTRPELAVLVPDDEQPAGELPSATFDVKLSVPRTLPGHVIFQGVSYERYLPPWADGTVPIPIIDRKC